MKVTKLNCTACGAPISIPDDLDYINCASCGSFLAIDRGEGYVALKMAEKISHAIDESGKETQNVVRESAQKTLNEIRRFQWSQESTSAHAQLAQVQDEIRFFQSAPRKGANVQKLRNLRFDEYQAMEHVRTVDNHLCPDESEDPTGWIQSSEKQVEWITMEMLALRESGSRKRKEIIKSLTAQRNALAGQILGEKVKLLQASMKSFQYQEIDLQNAAAIGELLQLMKADEKMLRPVRRTAEGKIVSAQLKNREQQLRQNLSAGTQGPIQFMGDPGGSKAAGQMKDILYSPTFGLEKKIGKQTQKGLLWGFLVLFGISLIGVVLASSPSGTDNGVFSLFAAIGLGVGGYVFLRYAAPGTHIRGFLGLADLTISGPTANEQLPSLAKARWMVGILTWLVIGMFAFALGSMISSADPGAGAVILFLGNMLALAAGVFIALRTTVLSS